MLLDSLSRPHAVRQPILLALLSRYIQNVTTSHHPRWFKSRLLQELPRRSLPLRTQSLLQFLLCPRTPRASLSLRVKSGPRDDPGALHHLPLNTFLTSFPATLPACSPSSQPDLSSVLEQASRLLSQGFSSFSSFRLEYSSPRESDVYRSLLKSHSLNEALLGLTI